MLPRTSIALAIATASLLTVHSASAQLLANESFTGIPPAPGLTGSGTDASGWLDTGWSGGADAHYEVVNPTPNLTFQPTGGLLIDGSDRAVQLTTNPEPVPGNGLVASRSLPSQNTTLYASFLVRPMVVGTGSDTLGVQFLQGTTLLGAWVLQPDQGQQFFTLTFISSSPNFQFGTSGNVNLNAGQTYLIVFRARQTTLTSSTAFFVDVWINPAAAYSPNNPPGTGRGFFTSGVAVDAIGLGISSNDTGGPSSTAIFDELRIGYTWNDVVPQGPPPPLVPDLQITRAVKVSWQTDGTKTYQVQNSYDLSTWFDFGSIISGDGNTFSFFDSADPDAQKFYRVQINDAPTTPNAAKPSHNKRAR